MRLRDGARGRTRTSRAELHDEYGSLLVQGQQNEKAAENSAEAVRLSPEFGQAKLHLGVVRWQQQQFDEAQKSLESAARFCRISASALLPGPSS